MTTTTRILIADDHPMFRKGLSALLKSLPQYEIVAEAADGAAAVALAQQYHPDVILMDVQMPDMNGIEATRQILHDGPQVGILMLTMYQDDDLVVAAMRAGARGYLLKGADQDEVVRAIETVRNGGAVFSPAVAARMMTYFSTTTPSHDHDLLPELTEREVEVLDLIAQGYNNAEIADQLVLSGKTVRNYVSNILSKLQVADRAQAIRRGRAVGLGRNEAD